MLQKVIRKQACTNIGLGVIVSNFVRAHVHVARSTMLRYSYRASKFFDNSSLLVYFRCPGVRLNLTCLSITLTRVFFLLKFTRLKPSIFHVQ